MHVIITEDSVVLLWWQGLGEDSREKTKEESKKEGKI